jgi:multisubunit Na+/H+ antiporter MnhG subunit
MNCLSYPNVFSTQNPLNARVAILRLPDFMLHMRKAKFLNTGGIRTHKFEIPKHKRSELCPTPRTGVVCVYSFCVLLAEVTNMFTGKLFLFMLFNFFSVKVFGRLSTQNEKYILKIIRQKSP